MQLEMMADAPFRIYEYNPLTSLALEAGTPAGQETPPIQSTVVLLSRREKPWPAHGTYRTSPENELFSGVTFRIDAIYQRMVAELKGRGPLWSIFTPLAIDADPVRMNEVLDKLRAATTPWDFGELSTALTVVATKAKRQRGLRESILSVLSEEDVMQADADAQPILGSAKPAGPVVTSDGQAVMFPSEGPVQRNLLGGVDEVGKKKRKKR